MTHYMPDPVPLYGPDYAADPHAVYARLREYGPLAPVEISPGVSAYLVTDHRAALDLLQDPDTWAKDPRRWQTTLPEDCPVLPMMKWRPNALFNDGHVHARYRSVITDSFSLIEPHLLRQQVAHAADLLIREFAATGETDLVTQYARPLPLVLFNALFGMPDHYSPRLVAALAGMFESTGSEKANNADADFEQYVMELVSLKQAQRGHDLTSWFMDHPAGLSLEEVIHQVVLTMAAGHEPTTNLISNSLSRMLSNPDYYSTLSGGALTARDAINDVLRNEPPMANYSAHFPRRNIRFHGTWIHANQLVLVSYHAANTTPDGLPADSVRTDGGAHLAWAAGPHACPVKHPALLIATAAIERLTSHLCDLELTVPRDQLSWRPGPFHRALAHLPARFTPITPDQAGVTPWTSSSPSPSTPPAATSTPKPNTSAPSAPPPA
ncbi:cytochrome P450 [Streptomyces lunaelactis]|uniref:cytochrome P450 n=1 Tax=Streptomyces lunaelactis TaxID=1535768 RepID=UPI0015856FF7|nr:cytochrome P450 [Streptomyces lunaelactis]NUK32234.1 cytochrome P450 [Streptomyces lunaelactis]NUK41276.1 cytochrome P450 [Streptomyces lunaelactis]